MAQILLPCQIFNPNVMSVTRFSALARMLFPILSSILLTGVAVHAAVGRNANGTCFLTSADLTVTVWTNSGGNSISVYDNANGLTWNQRANSDESGAWSGVTLLPSANAIGFNASFKTNSGFPVRTIATTVTLSLTNRSLTMTVDVADHSTPLSTFNFIEPFQPASGMYFVVPEFTDGKIYSCDLSAWTNFNLDSIRVLNLTMPWVGVVNPDTGVGYSLTVNTPNDAQLSLAMSGGLRSPLIGWNGQKGQFGYARSMTYYFTSSGGYVELAKAYRTNAIAQGLIVPFTQKILTRTNISKLYGAALLWDMLDNLSDKELRAMGVAKAVHHADWGDDRTALDVANKMGYLTEEYDYYEAGPTDGLAQTYGNYHISVSDCAKDSSQNVLMLINWGERSPATYLTAGQSIIPNRIAAMPTTSRYIDQMTQNILGHDVGPRGGGSTDEDYDPGHLLTRTDWVNDCYNFYQWLTTLNLITGAELGKYYQVPVTEIFYGMGSSWEPWGQDMFPDFYGEQGDGTTNTVAYDNYINAALNPALRVPLWELVFHDCSIAPIYPWDAADECYKLGDNDPDFQGVKDCQNILYGTPSLFLCQDGGESQFSWPVSDVTHTNRLRWLQSYRNTCKVAEALADKEMVSHQFLTGDRMVQETRWSDGTRIVVNFGTNDYFADVGNPYSQLLRQNCFTVKGPWGGASRSYYYGPARIVTYIWKDGYHFDDEQLSGGQPVGLAHWRIATNNIRVNVDLIPGNTNVSFYISPLLVQSNWDFSTTRVFQCDPVTGGRIAEIPWTMSGSSGIQVSGLSGWIVLDVVCDVFTNDYQRVVMSYQPAAYYSFTGDGADPTTANNLGLTGGANGIIYSADELTGQGPEGSDAFYFNGTNSFVSLGNPSALNFTGQITMEAWIKPAAFQRSAFANIVSHGVNDANTAEVMMRLTDGGYYQVGSWNGSIGPGAAFAIPAVDLNGSNWVYLAGTYDGANWNLYRNGTMVASASGSFGSILVNDDDWAVGARGAGDSRFFTGDIADVAIYNYALSPAAIKSHYYVGISGIPSLAIGLTNRNAILIWPAGTLQQAGSVSGSYVNVFGANSPYNVPANASQKFYRLKL